MPQQDLPTHLGHKPVFAVPYFDHDGPLAGATDTHFLSVGWAQYDSHQVSAKVFRQTEQRWSRQSEELPPHRVVDLTILLALALDGGCNKGEINLPSGTLEGQKEAIKVPCAENDVRRRSAFTATLNEDGLLAARLGKLADVLQDLRVKKLI